MLDEWSLRRVKPILVTQCGKYSDGLLETSFPVVLDYNYI